MRTANELYELIKTRERRDQHQSWACQARDARDAARAVLERPSLRRVEKFARLERHWSHERGGGWPLAAPEMKVAVGSAAVEPPRRRINSYLTGDDPSEGWVYAFSSRSRPDELKIGYTTLSMNRRLQNFRRSKGPSDATVAFAAWVRRPSLLEHDLHHVFSSRRCAGYAPGGSTEWFRCSLDEVVGMAKALSFSIISDDDI